MNSLLAQITNPALPSSLQDASTAQAAGSGFAQYIAILWLTGLTLGGLASMLYMFWGALDWILAGGEKGKIEEAKKKITQSIVGLAVLFSVTAISVVVGTVLGINLLQPNFQSITGGSTGGTTRPNQGSVDFGGNSPNDGSVLFQPNNGSNFAQ